MSSPTRTVTVFLEFLQDDFSPGPAVFGNCPLDDKFLHLGLKTKLGLKYFDSRKWCEAMETSLALFQGLINVIVLEWQVQFTS